VAKSSAEDEPGVESKLKALLLTADGDVLAAGMLNPLDKGERKVAP
jgi:hypothetical protein